MGEIMAIADNYGLKIIEDNAESIGARYKGKLLGTFGDVSTYSFFGNKIITTGEGGAILTNDTVIDKKVRSLRTHGMTKNPNQLEKNHGPWYYEMHEIGYNYRITDFQCALGNNQLKKLDKFVERRTAIIEPKARFEYRLTDSGKEYLKQMNDPNYLFSQLNE